jgi:hypothetical protein
MYWYIDLSQIQRILHTTTADKSDMKLLYYGRVGLPSLYKEILIHPLIQVTMFFIDLTRWLIHCLQIVKYQSCLHCLDVSSGFRCVWFVGFTLCSDRLLLSLHLAFYPCPLIMRIKHIY